MPARRPDIRKEVPIPPAIPGLFHLYFLRCADGSLYTGQTCNLRERLRKHSYGLGSRHTAKHRPLTLIYVEGPYTSLGKALRREHQIKGWSHAKKEALAGGDFRQLHELAIGRTAARTRRAPLAQSPATHKKL